MRRTAPFASFSRLNPNPPKATFCLGTSSSARFKAKQDSRRSWRAYKFSAQALHRRNIVKKNAGLGRREEAAAAYQQAIDWQSGATLKDAGPYIDFGDLLLDENRNEEAVSYLLQAIGVAPRESRAHELLGKAYTRLEQLPRAQSELEKAIEISPKNANLHCMLAPVYRKQGFADKAKIEFDRCAALAGSHSVPSTPRP